MRYFHDHRGSCKDLDNNYNIHKTSSAHGALSECGAKEWQHYSALN